MNPYAIPGYTKTFKTLEDFLDLVSEETEVSKKAILSKSRRERIKDARHVYCYLARKYTLNSLKAIGRVIGRADHTTVLNSVGVVKNFIETEDIWRERMAEIEKKIPLQPAKHKTIERSIPVQRKKYTDYPQSKLFERPKAQYSNRP